MAKKPLEIAKLNELFTQSKSCDDQIFAEQRSNVLLVSGDHYTRKGSKFWNRIRDNKDLNNEQKLRLTKNHIQRICKAYVSNILTYAPSVTVLPNNESVLQDQKSAELNNSVWQWIRKRHDIRGKTREWVKDFIDIGEVAVKIFWDPMAGEFKGYKQKLGDDGQPVFDSSGQPSGDTNQPVFTGDLVYERIFGFNLLRAPEAKAMRDSRYFIVQKMVNTEELKIRVGDDEERLKAVGESKDETFMVFDGSRGEYMPSKNETMLKEIYFRPCPEYPRGYYYIFTTAGKLWEGELPFGVFPIIYEGFDAIPTTPRHHSIIKQLRPYQAEINRAASQIAMHQMVLGDDKVIYQAGSKLENGAYLPGIRGLRVSGAPPTILPGRTGEQYLPYMQSQIEEMYQVADMALDAAEDNKDQDPYLALYKNSRQKKKNSQYAEKIEYFLIQVCEVSLNLLRNYLPDDILIYAIGKRERINIPEFRTSDCLGYHIKLEPQTDDPETMYGKQLTGMHILQYVGSQLDKSDVGKVIRQLPYGNSEEAFSDFTMDYDNIKNDMLAMERGEPCEAKSGDTHELYIKKINTRMRQADFKFLDPQVKMLYVQCLRSHEQMKADELKQIQMAESGFIPTTGYAVVCDLYVPMPGDAKKTQRARVPYDSLKWLLEKLESQGSTQQAMADMPMGAQAQVAQLLQQSPPAAGEPGQVPLQPPTA